MLDDDINNGSAVVSEEFITISPNTIVMAASVERTIAVFIKSKRLMFKIDFFYYKRLLVFIRIKL